MVAAASTVNPARRARLPAGNYPVVCDYHAYYAESHGSWLVYEAVAPAGAPDTWDCQGQLARIRGNNRGVPIPPTTPGVGNLALRMRVWHSQMTCGGWLPPTVTIEQETRTPLCYPRFAYNHWSLQGYDAQYVQLGFDLPTRIPRVPWGILPPPLCDEVGTCI